jgi:hypothetical protein
MRWKFDDPALLHLYPVTYVLHLLEEWTAAAPLVQWGVRADHPLDATTFVAANIIGLVLMIAGIVLVGRTAAFAWVVPALGTAVALNTAGHVVGSVVTGGYSAGLVTAVVLWIPLALLTLLRVWDQASGRTFTTGLAAGLIIELVVVSVLPAVSAAN